MQDAPTSLDPILAEIEQFIAERGMTPTAFGMGALKDPNLIPDLRAGRECKRSTAERIRAFMAEVG